MFPIDVIVDTDRSTKHTPQHTVSMVLVEINLLGIIHIISPLSPTLVMHELLLLSGYSC